MTISSPSAPTLRGKRVTLRPMTHADAPHAVRWANDADFAWYQWGRRPGRFPDEEAARKWMDVIAEHRGVMFVIEHQGRPIGQANYRDLQPKGKSAEVGIGIGEPALWGKGLGREALGLLVKHLVDDHQVHRVTLSVLAYNDRAIASYKAAGFEVEGIERDGVMTDRGTWADDVKMAYVVGRARPEFDPRPVVLTGTHVRLEPLRREHAAELFPVAHDDDIWRLFTVPMPRDVGELERWSRSSAIRSRSSRGAPATAGRSGARGSCTSTERTRRPRSAGPSSGATRAAPSRTPRRSTCSFDIFSTSSAPTVCGCRPTS